MLTECRGWAVGCVVVLSAEWIGEVDRDKSVGGANNVRINLII